MLGHQRIGFVAGRPGLWCSRARLDGYRAGLEAVGLSVDPDLVVQGDFDYASGFEGATRLLSLDDRPTAVFAASDQMALGVYEAARQRGLLVPEELSVVGFDDLPQACCSSPPLTTVRQPLSEMGVLAVRTVLRLLNVSTSRARRSSSPPRSSCATARRLPQAVRAAPRPDGVPGGTDGKHPRRPRGIDPRVSEPRAAGR